MNAWFRVNTSAPDSPAVLKLARVLDVQPVVALGIAITVEAQLALHAPDGNMRAVAAHLEHWIGQLPKPIPMLADRVLEALADSEGYHDDFVDRNEALFRDFEKNRERARQRRAGKREREAAETTTNPTTELSERSASATVDPDAIPFEGRDTLPREHPRLIAWRNMHTAPSEPTPCPTEPSAQLAVLWWRWRYRVGEVEEKKWRSLVTPALQSHGIIKVWNAIEAFHEARDTATDRERHFMTLHKWLDSLPDYIEWGMTPLERHGKPTHRLRRLTA